MSESNSGSGKGIFEFSDRFGFESPWKSDWSKEDFKGVSVSNSGQNSALDANQTYGEKQEAPGPGQDIEHRLGQNQTLWDVAKMYDVTVSQLQVWNPSTIDREKSLDVGELILVKTPQTKLIAREADRRPGIGDDMKFNDFSDEEIKDLFRLNRGNIELLRESDSWLFSNMTRRIGQYMDRDDEMYGGVLLNMIDHFKNGDGQLFRSPILTRRAIEHPSTQRFIKHVQKEFKEKALATNGIGWDFSLDLIGRPRFNRTYADGRNGLLFAVNQVWTYELWIDRVIIEGDFYKATVTLKLYDHFGLDAPDIEKYGVYDLFASWFILQHNRGYKPFITYIPINLSITGWLK